MPDIPPRSSTLSLDTPELVCAYHDPDAHYPADAPYHPGEAFPEYGFAEVAGEPNRAYAAVRACFHAAGLDAARFGTPEWNPLGGLIAPGETVLLKPNLVRERHPRDPEGWRYVVTHGSIVRAVADFVYKALDGRGRVVVADAPQTDSVWEGLVRVTGLNEIRAYYAAQGLDFDVVDLRLEEWTEREGVIVGRRPLPGDPRGTVAYDLGADSEFEGHGGGGRYYGADYDSAEVNRHHTGGRHEYKIAGSAIHCDVLFSLPKLKTHKKAGITATLKNLVGVNGDKNWLPHHTEGAPATGGDERPEVVAKGRFERNAVAVLRRMSLSVPVLGTWVHRRARSVGRRVFGDNDAVIRSGNWSGNDTVWRMCLDLNKLILYGNPDGTLRPGTPENRKRHYALVDGILAGEGSGPGNPDPVQAGVLIFGVHPASVDAACAYLMGFDPGRIPIVRGAFECRGYPLAEWAWQDVRLVSNRADWDGRRLPDVADAATFHFRPHFGWTGRLERRAHAPDAAA
jgi:uncharacterized protein (DUF362 family)